MDCQSTNNIVDNNIAKCFPKADRQELAWFLALEEHLSECVNEPNKKLKPLLDWR
jgi:hypothetical protein